MWGVFRRRIFSIVAVNDKKSLDSGYTVTANQNDDNFDVYLRGVDMDDPASSVNTSTREKLHDFC